MLRLKPYQAADLAQIEPRQYERELAVAGIDCAQVYAMGPAWTLFDNEKPVMAGGVVPHWRNRGEAWLALSPWFEKHALTGYKYIRLMFSAVLVEHPEMTRIEAPICAIMAKNLRLVRHLGFEHEGLMRKWDPQSRDYVMTAYIR